MSALPRVTVPATDALTCPRCDEPLTLLHWRADMTALALVDEFRCTGCAALVSQITGMSPSRGGALR